MKKTKNKNKHEEHNKKFGRDRGLKIATGQPQASTDISQTLFFLFSLCFFDFFLIFLFFCCLICFFVFFSLLLNVLMFFWFCLSLFLFLWMSLCFFLFFCLFFWISLCLFCFCDFASSSHSLSCVASLLVVSLRHLQVEVCYFFFCLFVKGLDRLRDCVANGIIGIEWWFNLKLGIYIFFLPNKSKFSRRHERTHNPRAFLVLSRPRLFAFAKNTPSSQYISLVSFFHSPSHHPLLSSSP